MPTTPDALQAARDAVEALPSHLFDRTHTDEIAENLAPEFDRFAAQHGAELLTITISDEEMDYVDKILAGPAPDNELLHMTEHNVAVAAAAYCRSRNSLGRHDSGLLHVLEDALAERDRVAQQPIGPQTGGGDAGERAREDAGVIKAAQRVFDELAAGGFRVPDEAVLLLRTGIRAALIGPAREDEQGR